MGSPIIRYEAGQTAYPFEAMTNGGDATVFSASFFPISNAAGFESVVAPYGLMTGGAITPHTDANKVTVAALTASMAGAATADASGVVAVAAAAVTITRAATNVSKVNSITVDATGALAAVAGTDGATTAFFRSARRCRRPALHSCRLYRNRPGAHRHQRQRRGHHRPDLCRSRPACRALGLPRLLR